MNTDLFRECCAASERAYREATLTHAPTSTEVLIWNLGGQPDEVGVAFRGSKEPLDFIMDARFVLKQRWPGHDAARVHTGFFTGYQAVANDVVKAVARASRIVITGHSLGGARAILCGAHLVEMGLPVSDVITFGAPRVGNAAFRDFYNDELEDLTLRFEAQGDIVPWTPPWLLNGYRHVGQSVYLRDNGTADFDPILRLPVNYVLAKLAPRPSALDDQQLSRQLFGLFDPHAMTNYQRLLDNVEEIAW